MSYICIFGEDVRACRSCGAYLYTGLEETVHPNHFRGCRLHPDKAWPGYVIVKLADCNYKVGYHADPHHGCLEHRNPGKKV